MALITGTKFSPVDESEFKPRLNKKICQYCSYKSSSQLHVDAHVNVQHELSLWYQCSCCKTVEPDARKIEKHLWVSHQIKIGEIVDLKRLLVADLDRIRELKSARIRENLVKSRRKVKERTGELEPVPVEGGSCAKPWSNHPELRSDPQFFPVDRADFKPRIIQNACQYCGFQTAIRANIDCHVNTHHEMIDWYKCQHCLLTSLYPFKHFKKHYQARHDRDITAAEIFKLRVIDAEEIDKLKKNRIKEISESGEVSKNIKLSVYPEEVDGIGSFRKKAGIEMNRKFFVPVEDDDFKPRISDRVCQYCGFTSNEIGKHVNDHHEMTRWYKCTFCKYVDTNIRSHLSIKHGLKNQTLPEINRFLVKNPKEIWELKLKRIQKFRIAEEKKERAKDGDNVEVLIKEEFVEVQLEVLDEEMPERSTRSVSDSNIAGC